MHLKQLSSLAFSLALCVAASAQDGRYDWSMATAIDDGVRFAAVLTDTPRKLEVYCLQIDAGNPRIRFHTTGRIERWTESVSETTRQTTRDFVRESRAAGLNMIAAINADVFEPWPAPYAQRTPSNLRGLAISNGVLVSPASENSPSFVVYEDRRVAILSKVSDVSRISVAVSGYAIILQDGQPLVDRTDLQPRTGIGLDHAARFVYLIVVDGRRHASIGTTTEELARWLLHFGAQNAMNLDGGGSSTMVRYDESVTDDGVVLLNNPVGDGAVWTKLPEDDELAKYSPTERTNGNNLGVYLASD